MALHKKSTGSRGELVMDLTGAQSREDLSSGEGSENPRVGVQWACRTSNSAQVCDSVPGMV